MHLSVIMILKRNDTVFSSMILVYFWEHQLSYVQLVKLYNYSQYISLITSYFILKFSKQTSFVFYRLLQTKNINSNLGNKDKLHL